MYDKPFVSPTNLLIFLNGFVYLFVAFANGGFVTVDLKLLAFYGALFAPAVVEGNEWWRLISAMFLHGGTTHLLMNMVSLYIVGRMLERFVSPLAYLVIYFASGIIGGLLSLYLHPLSVGVGASGAIFGIFGALIGIFAANKARMGVYFHEAMKEFAAVLAINLFIGIVVPEIDMTAHIGGLVTGIVGGWLYGYNKRTIWLFTGLFVVVSIYLASTLHSHYAAIVR